MGSIATTVDEQLKILTDRGMTFDYEEAKLTAEKIKSNIQVYPVKKFEDAVKILEK